MKPKVASNPDDPSPLIPLPARCTGLACTGAGRGQGEGQVPLRMKGHYVTEKPVSCLKLDCASLARFLCNYGAKPSFETRDGLFRRRVAVGQRQNLP